MRDKHLFIFGLGYVGQHLANSLHKDGWRITGTTRTPEKLIPKVPSDWHIIKFEDGEKIPDLSSYLAQASHVITTISALAGYDPVLRMHEAEMRAFSGWAGYVSATSVYQDQENGFIDETVSPIPATPRGRSRLAAEHAWNAICNAEIFRVAGIYGPNRNAILDLQQGNARIIEKEGQISNRIHQTDISKIIIAAMAKPRPLRIINLCDQEPAAQGDVVRYAASLLGIKPPEPIAFEDAELTAMARSFYVSKRRLRSVIIGPELGVSLSFPTYKQGLESLLKRQKNN